MNWKVITFESTHGGKPVDEFIKRQPSLTQAKITRLIDLLEKYGTFLVMPHSKKLTKELYELRVRGKHEIRIIYGFKDRRIFLLNAFKKQTQKTPSKEITTAVKRFETLH